MIMYVILFIFPPLYFSVCLCIYLSKYSADGISSDIKVRLSGHSNRSGTVELGFYGAWGTICHHNWDIHDANVICRMLGYPRAIAAPLHSSLAIVSGRIWTDSVQCNGEEKSILDCQFSSFGSYSSSCNHLTDAGVVCDG